MDENQNFNGNNGGMQPDGTNPAGADTPTNGSEQEEITAAPVGEHVSGAAPAVEPIQTPAAEPTQASVQPDYYQNNLNQYQQPQGTQPLRGQTWQQSTQGTQAPQGQTWQQTQQTANSPQGQAWQQNPQGMQSAQTQTGYTGQDASSTQYQTPYHPQYQQASYQGSYQSPYQAQYGTAPENPNQGKGLAIASLVLGIISLVLFCSCINIPLAIAGVVCGAVFLAKRASQGKGMAIAGIITSAVSVVLLIVFWSVAISTFGVFGLDNFNDIYDEIYDDLYDEYSDRYDDDYDDDDDYYYDDDWDDYYDDDDDWGMPGRPRFNSSDEDTTWIEGDVLIPLDTDTAR